METPEAMRLTFQDNQRVRGADLLHLLVEQLGLSDGGLPTTGRALMLARDYRPAAITLDVFLPFSKVPHFMRWFRNTFDYFPLWCVPYRRVRDYDADPGERCDPRGRDLGGHPSTAEIGATTSGASLELGGDPVHLVDNGSIRNAPWVIGMQSARVGQQREHLRVREIAHQSGQTIVVAEADLVDRDRVVLIDYRNDPQREQPVQGVACVEVVLAIHEVVAGQQQLRGGAIAAWASPGCRRAQPILQRGNNVRRAGDRAAARPMQDRLPPP